MDKDLKIALVKLSSLGDIVHASIVLQFIKKHLPNSKISWFVDEKFSQILQNCAFLDEVIALPLKDKKFLKSYEILKNTPKFDVIIDLQGLIKSAIVTKILGKNSFGFDKFSIKEPIASYFYKHKLNISYDENIIIRNLSLVAKALNFTFSKDEIAQKSPCFFGKEAQKFKNRILIAPFASEKSKCYKRFDELINLLKKYEIFICYGNENEKKEAEKLALKSDAKILEKLNFDELINFLKSCALIVGNDSGITHLAWALNLPSITLFGNRPSKRNAFVGKKNLILDVNKKIDAKKIDKNDFCINEIEPKNILKKIEEILNG